MTRFILALLALLVGTAAHAQGTLPITLQQQFSFTGCSSAANVCGTPLAGGLLYFYQVGTVTAPQNSYQDTGLTILNPWPLVLDANGRVPAFYLASGSVHVRLTDSGGVVQFDYPSMLVIGPSGGGGGGGAVDPTTIASTGDIKFRATGETLSGWVKANGTTIGNSGSGASQRANADTQNLFVYLWTNCPQTHCPVTAGFSRGASGLADFNSGCGGSGCTIQLFDLRGRIPYGLDDMGTTPSLRLLAQNITGPGDTTTTPNGVAGETNHTLLAAEMPTHTHAGEIVDPGHSHNVTDTHSHQYNAATGFSGSFQIGGGAAAPTTTTPTQTSGTNSGAITVNGAGTGVTFQDGLGHLNVTQSAGGGGSHNIVNNSILGSWYVRL